MSDARSLTGKFLFFEVCLAVLAVVGFFASAKPFFRPEKVASAAPFFNNGTPPVKKAEDYNSHSPLKKQNENIEYSEE